MKIKKIRLRLRYTIYDIKIYDSIFFLSQHFKLYNTIRYQENTLMLRKNIFLFNYSLFIETFFDLSDWMRFIMAKSNLRKRVESDVYHCIL